MERIDIAIVCVHYEPKNVALTLQSLNRIVRSIGATHAVFVANQHAVWTALTNVRPLLDECATEVCEHDNTGMEFGAYQAGLNQVITRFDPAWVLFVNDTFATHHSFGTVYRRKLAEAFGGHYPSAAIIGRVDALPRSFEVQGLRTHRWVTTNLFALNRKALNTLGNRMYSPEINQLVGDTCQSEEFFAPQVDPVLRGHLEAWLFRAHPGPHWYASEPLTGANAAKMARKARSILQEKFLSAALDAAAAQFVNLNELSMRDKLVREVEQKLFGLIGQRP